MAGELIPMARDGSLQLPSTRFNPYSSLLRSCGRGEMQTHRPLKPARFDRRLRVQDPPSALNFILRL